MLSSKSKEWKQTFTKYESVCHQTRQAKKRRGAEEDVTATPPRPDIVVESRINNIYIHLLTLWFHH